MLGANLGWMEETIPPVVVILLAFTMVICALIETDQITVLKKDAHLMRLIISMCIVFTPMMLLSYTSRNSPVINGLQGRYFLPVLPLILLSCTKYTLRIHHNTMTKHDTEDMHLHIVRIYKKCLSMFLLLSVIAVYYAVRLYVSR